MTVNIDVAARTHRGLIRPSNQDAVLTLHGEEAPNRALAVAAVADGMGGLPAGDVASSLAIEALRDRLTSDIGEGPLRELLPHAMEDANRAVCEDAADNPEHNGMGTTLTVALVTEDRIFIAHIGDSSAYLLRDSRLEQLTVDHTWVQEGLDAGTLTPAEAATHPYRNMLTRGIGLDPNVAIFLLEQRLVDGDVLLVCSDGLHGEVEEDRIEQVLTDGTASEITQTLEEAALASGGADNVTTAVMKAVR